MEYAHEKREPKKKLRSYPVPKVTEGLWGDMYDYLFERNLDPNLAELNGWYPTERSVTRELHDRIVIPATRTDGGPAYWQAREMFQASKLRYQSPPIDRGDSLVIVYPETKDKNSLQRKRNVLVVVEGPMDALAAAACGVVGIAVMGNNPKREALDHLLRWHCGSIATLVVADSDSVGEAGQLAGFLSSCGERPARVVTVSPTKDLAKVKTVADRKAKLGL